ncbi:MAG: class I SAM-dependent methyltransferase [Deltaproteobacteria bacterium]|nr:class I SAM-dependent methyltransferase [Deltaproteobacteria bacterium]
MTPFKTVGEAEVQRINRLQQNSFDEQYQILDPPLPEGVPERLEKIVAHGRIAKGDTVLDVGSGTGILIPIIKKYKPGCIHACDLSRGMLNQYPLDEFPAGFTVCRIEYISIVPVKAF